MKNFIIVAIILSVAVLSFWAGGHLGKSPASSASPLNGRKILYYVDPMTPGFRSDKPGVAPCGMPLEPVYAEADGGMADMSVSMARQSPGAVKVSPTRQQLIGVKSVIVEKKPMTYFLRLYGKVVPDETKINVINASTDCWIRELSDITTGSIVQKDQVFGEALAPAYYNAQLTYLIALDNIDRIKR